MNVLALVSVTVLRFVNDRKKQAGNRQGTIVSDWLKTAVSGKLLTIFLKPDEVFDGTSPHGVGFFIIF